MVRFYRFLFSFFLLQEYAKPYIIPVGGSSHLGVWGYLECFNEIQAAKTDFDEIFFACGSGGTAAGLAIGKYLNSDRFKNTKLIGYCVCDNEDYFYKHVQSDLDYFGIKEKASDLIEFRMAKGLGYSLNTEEEINVVKDVAKSSGILLDSCYSGKAVKAWIDDQRKAERKAGQSQRSLFIHTSGIFNVFGVPPNVLSEPNLVDNFFK